MYLNIATARPLTTFSAPRLSIFSPRCYLRRVASRVQRRASLWPLSVPWVADRGLERVFLITPCCRKQRELRQQHIHVHNVRNRAPDKELGWTAFVFS